MAGADVTRVTGITVPRTGDGSRPAKECSRMRPAVGGGVGRSEVREGGVGDGDWDCERGLSGEGVRGEEDKGSGERLEAVLATGNGGDGVAFDVPAELEEDDEGGDS
jgi:hypothetical protein